MQEAPRASNDVRPARRGHGQAIRITPQNLQLPPSILEVRRDWIAVWRAARAVGDHDLNNFLLRADPVDPTPKLEPGMTVWIDEGA